MTLPRLKEVGIAVQDLEAATNAWKQASGFDARIFGQSGAVIEAGAVKLRLLRVRDMEGLFSVDLAVTDLEAVGKRLRLLSPNAPSISRLSGGKRDLMLAGTLTHGVNIRIFEERRHG